MAATINNSISLKFTPQLGADRVSIPIKSVISPYLIGQWSVYHSTTMVASGGTGWSVGIGVAGIAAEQPLKFVLGFGLSLEEDILRKWPFTAVKNIEVNLGKPVSAEHGGKVSVLVNTEYQNKPLIATFQLSAFENAPVPLRPALYEAVGL